MALEVTINSLPADGGSAITRVDYRLNGGAAVDAGVLSGTFSFAGVATDTVELRAVNANGEGPWSNTKTSQALTINSVGPQESTGNVPLAYSTSADRSVDAVLFDAAEADPVAADFNGGNATYTDIGDETLLAAGSSVNFTLPDGEQGSYKIAFLHSTDQVVVSNAFTLDTTDSLLSPVSFAAGAGAGEVDWSFTPDEDSAAVLGYRVSLFADGSTPSDAAIKDGTGSVVSVTGTAAASVAESGTLTGADGVIYVPTIYYIDAFGNEVFNTYADVTAGAAGGDPVEFLGEDFIEAAQTTYTFAGKTLSAGDKVGVHVFYETTDSGNAGVTSVNIDGNSASVISDGVDDAFAASVDVVNTVYEATVAGASGTIEVIVPVNAKWMGVRWFKIEPGASFDKVLSYGGAGLAAPWASDLSLATTLGGAALACLGVDRDATLDTITGVTRAGTALKIGATSARSSSGIALSTVAETRTIEIGDTAVSTGRVSGISIAMSFS